jgi:DNA-binding CsgD family transcriptional regulator
LDAFARECMNLGGKMGRLDTEHILDLLYGAVTDASMLDSVLRKMMSDLHSHVGILQFNDVHASSVKLPILKGPTLADVTPHLEVMGHGNPWITRQFEAFRPGYVSDCERVVSENELLGTRFYNEPCREFDIRYSTGIVLDVAGPQVANLTLSRAWGMGAFTPEEYDYMRRLAPHWVNAYRLSQRLRVAEQFAAGLDLLDHTASRPLWMIDSRRRVVHANATGEAMLAQGVYLTRVDGLLTTRQWGHRAAFEEVVSAAARRGGRLAARIDVTEPAANATIHIQRLPPAVGLAAASGELALITLEVTARQPAKDDRAVAASLTRSYRLTAAEARLAVALHQSHKLSCAAATLGISLGNARTTLKRIFAKTGTLNQQHLVLLVERLRSAPSTQAQTTGAQDPLPG